MKRRSHWCQLRRDLARNRNVCPRKPIPCRGTIWAGASKRARSCKQASLAVVGGGMAPQYGLWKPINIGDRIPRRSPCNVCSPRPGSCHGAPRCVITLLDKSAKLPDATKLTPPYVTRRKLPKRQPANAAQDFRKRLKKPCGYVHPTDLRPVVAVGRSYAAVHDGHSRVGHIGHLSRYASAPTWRRPRCFLTACRADLRFKRRIAGSGRSGLAYPRRFPVEKPGIERSFASGEHAHGPECVLQAEPNG
jgi:hypothetical protein